MRILGFLKTIKQKRRIKFLRIVIRLYYMWTMTVVRCPLTVVYYFTGTFFNVSVMNSQNNGTVSILSASSGE